jgi:hypothetical protein
VTLTSVQRIAFAEAAAAIRTDCDVNRDRLFGCCFMPSFDVARRLQRRRKASRYVETKAAIVLFALFGSRSDTGGAGDSVKLKSSGLTPRRAAPVIVGVPTPVLVTVTALAVLVVFTCWLPKLMLAGLTVAIGLTPTTCTGVLLLSVDLLPSSP